MIVLRKIKANITLTLVLVISAFLLLGGIALILSTIDTNKSAKSFSNLELAQLKAKSCLEESLYRLRVNSSYTGNFTLTFNSTDNCTGTITNGTGSIKNVSIISTVSTYSYQTSKTIDISTFPYTVSN